MSEKIFQIVNEKGHLAYDSPVSKGKAERILKELGEGFSIKEITGDGSAKKAK